MSTRRVFVLTSLAAFTVLAAFLETPQALSAAVGVRLMHTRLQQLSHFTMYAVVTPPQPTLPAVRRAVDNWLRLPERSAGWLDPLVRCYPDCLSVYEWRGVAHFWDGRAVHKPNASLQLAREDFDRAIQLAPNRADNYYNRASASFDLGDETAAEADCTRALEIGFRPFNARKGAVYQAEWVLKSRAAVRARMGNWRGAIEDYSRLLDVQIASREEEQSTGRDWSLLRDRALCFYKLQEYELALADYDAAVRIAKVDGWLRLQPLRVNGYGELLLDRAYAQAEAGHIQAARADFHKVVEIITQPSREWEDSFPEHIASLAMASPEGTSDMLLGYARAALGETNDAILSFERAVEYFAMHKAEALQTQARLCLEEVKGWS